MGLFAMISHKIGDNLVRSNVIKEEDAEIYIYGINQIFVSVLNVSSALIIGLILGMFLESIIFMAAYIPLRSFAGGYHAKTPLRCYFTSLTIISRCCAQDCLRSYAKALQRFPFSELAELLSTLR